MYRGTTAEGYIYYRDRANGHDVTIYEHQLMALLENDPREVFDENTDIHHVAPAPDANVPWLLEVVDRYGHRSSGGDRYDAAASSPVR